MYDLIIKNANILDGSGGEAYTGDIAITDGKIAAIGTNLTGAKEILDQIYFYPPAKHFYRSCICGRACDRACYIHLEEKGVLTKKFQTLFVIIWHLLLLVVRMVIILMKTLKKKSMLTLLTQWVIY